MLLPITLTMAGASALLNAWLGFRCSQVRGKAKVSVGDGGNPQVLARMRAHSNFVEYTPFVLILIGLIEFARGPQTWLWLVGIAFLLSRILHAFGMDRPGTNPQRAIGIVGTLVVMVGLAIYALLLPYGIG
jgi:uncharacterized membrane protein YecN with MAPEG domain